MVFFTQNKYVMLSIVPVVIVLQSNYRRRKNKNKFNLYKKKILTLQKFIKKNLKKEFTLSKKFFKPMPKKTNKYCITFVNIDKLVVDIQKNVRRYLVQFKGSYEKTQPYSYHPPLNSNIIYYDSNDEDIHAEATDYSDIESDVEEIKEEKEEKSKTKVILDPRLHDIEVLLVKFFSKYNPSKISNIPAVVNFINQGGKSFESIQASLMKKYNANLNDIL